MDAEASRQPAVVILGAGVAGLATAWRLTQAGRRRVIVLERAEQAGGLAATVALDGSRLDVGSHRIHRDYFPEALTLLRTLLGDELLEVPRRGRLRLNGRYVPYPPTLVDFLAALGPVEIARCAAALVGARLRQRPTPRSYEDYLLPRVGQRAYDLFYAPYARKLFGLRPDQVAVSAAKTRISTESPFTLAAQMIARRRAPSRADVFYYPAGGFGSIPQALLSAARGRGAELRTGVTAQSLAAEGTRIGSIVFERDGESTTLPVDALVSTIPLAQLVRLVHPPAPASVGEAAAGLRWRGIRLLQVLINRSRCLEGETYYFPEERYCFGRISEPAQYSSRLRSRSDRTALNIEVICSPGDALWSLDEAEFLARVLRDVRAIDLFHPDEVLEHRSLRVPAVYPVYDLDYRDRLTRVLAWIASFDESLQHWPRRDVPARQHRPQHPSRPPPRRAPGTTGCVHENVERPPRRRPVQGQRLRILAQCRETSVARPTDEKVSDRFQSDRLFRTCLHAQAAGVAVGGAHGERLAAAVDEELGAREPAELLRARRRSGAAPRRRGTGRRARSPPSPRSASGRSAARLARPRARRARPCGCIACVAPLVNRDRGAVVETRAAERLRPRRAVARLKCRPAFSKHSRAWLKRNPSAIID